MGRQRGEKETDKKNIEIKRYRKKDREKRSAIETRNNMGKKERRERKRDRDR